MATAKALVQVVVDQEFQRCMALDLRTLDDIRKAVRLRMSGDIRGQGPSDHELQIMVSRNCLGEGEWQYHPAYSNPPRYVSRARVLELAQREVTHGLDVWERQELDAQLADLERGIAHWKAKHQRARDKVEELDALIQRARHHPLAGV